MVIMYNSIHRAIYLVHYKKTWFLFLSAAEGEAWTTYNIDVTSTFLAPWANFIIGIQQKYIFPWLDALFLMHTKFTTGCLYFQKQIHINWRNRLDTNSTGYGIKKAILNPIFYSFFFLLAN